MERPSLGLAGAGREPGKDRDLPQHEELLLRLRDSVDKQFRELMRAANQQADMQRYGPDLVLSQHKRPGLQELLKTIRAQFDEVQTDTRVLKYFDRRTIVELMAAIEKNDCKSALALHLAALERLRDRIDAKLNTEAPFTVRGAPGLLAEAQPNAKHSATVRGEQAVASNGKSSRGPKTKEITLQRASAVRALLDEGLEWPEVYERYRQDHPEDTGSDDAIRGAYERQHLGK